MFELQNQILRSNSVNLTATLNNLNSSLSYTMTITASTGIGNDSISIPITLQRSEKNSPML